MPAWISKVWDEITYPFPNFNYCTVDTCEWWVISSLYNECNNLSILELELVHITKRGPCRHYISPASRTTCCEIDPNNTSEWIFRRHVTVIYLVTKSKFQISYFCQGHNDLIQMNSSSVVFDLAMLLLQYVLYDMIVILSWFGLFWFHYYSSLIHLVLLSIFFKDASIVLWTHMVATRPVMWPWWIWVLSTTTYNTRKQNLYHLHNSWRALITDQ